VPSAVSLTAGEGLASTPQRHLRFRDHLRCDDADRELYEATKRELAARRWTYAQQYADA
jgi:GrpB-like predicted nucleotidyltransferase (UPF0157 family)